MKRILRVGERCALSKRKPKYVKLRYISLLAVLTTMCLYAVKQVSAQVAEPAATAVADIKPLQIGDTIPEWLWYHPLEMVNYPNKGGRQTMTLNAYRGKSIILDFWATWCSSCIKGFPKMDELKTSFGDELAIILVNAEQTGDNMSRINKMLARQKAKIGYEVTLPYTVGDSILQQVFPHRILPHYVWINKHGVLEATTFAREVTTANVSTLMQTGRVNLHLKKDVLEYEPKTSSFAELSTKVDMPVKYSSMLTGYTEGLGHSMGNGIMPADSATWRLYYINISLTVLYNTAFREETVQLSRSQLVFELPRESVFPQQYLGRAGYSGQYCYELIVPAADSNAVSRMLRADLVSRFNVEVERRRRKLTTFVVSPSADFTHLRSVSEYQNVKMNEQGRVKTILRMPMTYVIQVLNSRVSTPISGEFDDRMLVDIVIPDRIDTYPSAKLRNWLEDQGLKVTEEAREMDVAVFRQSTDIEP